MSKSVLVFEAEYRIHKDLSDRIRGISRNWIKPRESYIEDRYHAIDIVSGACFRLRKRTRNGKATYHMHNKFTMGDYPLIEEKRQISRNRFDGLVQQYGCPNLVIKGTRKDLWIDENYECSLENSGNNLRVCFDQVGGLDGVYTEAEIEIPILNHDFNTAMIKVEPACDRVKAFLRTLDPKCRFEERTYMQILWRRKKLEDRY